MSRTVKWEALWSDVIKAQMTQWFVSSGKMKALLGMIPAAALKVLLGLSSLDLVAENVARVLVYACVFANWCEFWCEAETCLLQGSWQNDTKDCCWKSCYNEDPTPWSLDNTLGLQIMSQR
jgi:hypothetical protein